MAEAELQILGAPVKAGGDLTVSVYLNGDRVLLILDMPERGDGIMATLDGAAAAYVSGLLGAAAGVTAPGFGVTQEADHG